MTQREIDDAEWQNPANWHGGILGLYCSRRDSRSFVPKRRTWAGVTINFAHPEGIVVLVLILIVSLVPIFVIHRSRHN